MACLPILSNPPSSSSSSSSLLYHQSCSFSSFHYNNIYSLLSVNPSNNKKKQKNSIQIRNRTPPSPTILHAAITESAEPKPSSDLLQDIADSFAGLPPDYLEQLPSDLRLDLNDAAFDLSNGPVLDECGQELGETLLNLSRAWEVADTSTSCSIAKKLPSLAGALSDNVKSAFGKRLVSSGRRFQSMGSYGQGELQRIAKAMIETGKLLSATPATDTNETSKVASRMFKFGELQVALTSDKAYIGAAISFVFAIISWELGQGVQNVPESSLQYANENALLLGKSLRGALLVMGYGTSILSAFATVGLILLGRQLKSEDQ